MGYSMREMYSVSGIYTSWYDSVWRETKSLYEMETVTRRPTEHSGNSESQIQALHTIFSLYEHRQLRYHHERSYLNC
jgi:hypothetical protein